MKKTIVTLTTLALFTVFAPSAQAQANKVCICHNIPNNPVTVCASPQAIANAHGLHLGDTDEIGKCEDLFPSPTDEPTPTDDPTPTPTDDPEPTPTDDPTPTPTDEPTPTDDPTPTPTDDPEPTPTDDPQPTPPNQPNCVAVGGTTVNVVNNNFMNVFQLGKAFNNTGHNVASGNIGNSAIVTGFAFNIFNFNVAGNTNNTHISLPNTGAVNNTNVINSGNNAVICTSAAS